MVVSYLDRVDEINRLLECPVCYEVPTEPPIYQCMNGHMICGDCKPRFHRCLQCSEPIEGRLLFVERMLDQISFPAAKPELPTDPEPPIKDRPEIEKGGLKSELIIALVFCVLTSFILLDWVSIIMIILITTLFHLVMLDVWCIFVVIWYI